MSTPRRSLVVLSSGLIAVGGLLAPAVVVPGIASAAPTIPDDLPVFERVVENPRVSVTREDGSPLDGGAVHRGDVLLVHGSGFATGANRGGFPLPVPPGVPNGVYALYSAFPDDWTPSSGAPGTVRDHPHDMMAWIVTDETLAAIPREPVDMHRSIARVAQPMGADGSFVARVVVDPPATPPGDRWGVYVYPAAGSVNASEEFFVPIPFSPEPGASAPAPVSPDLVLDAATVVDLTRAAGGGLRGRRGAQVVGGSDVTFTRDADRGDGITRYRGTAIATARFTVVDVAFADPWIEPRDGRTVLTALVSTAHDVGVDDMRRIEIAELDGAGPGVHTTRIGDVEIRR